MNELPKPDAWSRHDLMFGFIAALTAWDTGYLAFKAAAATTRTHWLAAAFAAAAAVAMIVAGAALLRARTRLRADFDSTGTTLSSPPVGLWLAIMGAGTIAGSVLYSALETHLYGQQPVLSVGAEAGLVVVMVCGVIGLMIRKGKHRRSIVTLSPDGLNYRDVAISNFQLPWDDIDDITGMLSIGKMFRQIVFKRRNRSARLVTDAAAWTPGGTALYSMVRHYWLHPEDRDELTNGIALQRLNNGRFTTE